MALSFIIEYSSFNIADATHFKKFNSNHLQYYHLQVSVHIFDTSGLPLFSEVRNEFYRDAHGLLLVMDVTKRESFDSLTDWVQEIKQEVTILLYHWALLSCLGSYNPKALRL